ncbi:uncharacterized protein PV09_08486 [Verruconis gallopava]|uniref:Moz protein represents a chromatin-associated acetyltransferase n=1 Tax=Verruconis gallopava TaxID=253628 RepID=A0A0D1YGQ8_9PEZI|nr:uncharacterized protein PV09_08486 [Verruconis gallopava]KIV99976.1 hypothetical protein PV09_08486 [Verruconis gallopava]
MSARSLPSMAHFSLRAVYAVEKGPIRTSVRDRPRRIRGVNFTTSVCREDDSRVQRRYGTANEPPAHFLDNQPREGRSGTTDTPPRPAESKKDLEQKQTSSPYIKEAEGSKKKTEHVEAEDITNFSTTAQTLDKDTTSGDASGPGPQSQLRGTSSKPLETVLNMPPPKNSENDKPPHLAPPPYVHHFDTYGLVKKLNSGGFTNGQSTTIMKAIRTILAENMDLARRGLVSKSNVENGMYLFRAACSELKTEIENNRKGELDKNRTRRALLQHEVDILGQKITQEISGLRDELKGMFDDRKMTVRTEQRNMENRIQELNYKITVTLNSDAKTEVEGVRWVLTRRAATALAVSVMMILATLNYARYMSATQDKERQKHRELMKANSTTSHNIGTQTEPTSQSGETLIASEGVSLG